MPTLIHLHDRLDYGGAARQVVLLACAQHAAGYNVQVCILGRSTPWAEYLLSRGISVLTLNRRWPFDVFPFLALARHLRSVRADIIHAWGPLAIRAAALLRTRWSRVIAAAALPPSGSPFFLDPWILRRVDAVLAFGSSEAAQYLGLGVAADRLLEVRPAVAPAPPVVAASLPKAGRVILTVGPIERLKGVHDAIWTLDILHYLFDDLQLVVVGSGEDRARVEAFCRSVGVTSRVHFVGAVMDPRPWYERAEIVWVPGRAGGINVALEAQAAGRPVVAARTAAMAEVVVDGETGALFPAGDKPALARQTRILLDDADRARRLGLAGQKRMADLFSPEQVLCVCDRFMGRK